MSDFKRLPKLIIDAFKYAIYNEHYLKREDSKLCPARNVYSFCPYCGKRMKLRSSSRVYRCWTCNHIFLVKAFFEARK